MDFIALRSSNINKRLYVSFSKTPQVYPVLTQSSAQVLKQMWQQGCPNKNLNVFQHSVEISVPILIWFGNFLIREVSVQFPDSGTQYPPPCREVLLIVNCSYHFKNPMLSLNLCKPQKIFDTFSCIPLVSNVRKLTQASWGEKREWNKRGILQWFQLLNQSPSSKEAALARNISSSCRNNIAKSIFRKLNENPVQTNFWSQLHFRRDYLLQ